MRLSIANEELERQRLHVERINDRLKRENRFKSDFLAIVSHELRTPLTSILAFADLMEESVPPSNELARTQLGEIGKNGRILLEMVDNVLETARIQVGSEKLNLEWIDLGDVVGMVEASSRPLAEKKSIEFTVAIDADGYPRRLGEDPADSCEPRQQRDQIHRKRRDGPCRGFL